MPRYIFTILEAVIAYMTTLRVPRVFMCRCSMEETSQKHGGMSLYSSSSLAAVS